MAAPNTNFFLTACAVIPQSTEPKSVHPQHYYPFRRATDHMHQAQTNLVPARAVVQAGRTTDYSLFSPRRLSTQVAEISHELASRPCATTHKERLKSSMTTSPIPKRRKRTSSHGSLDNCPFAPARLSIRLYTTAEAVLQIHSARSRRFNKTAPYHRRHEHRSVRARITPSVV